MMEFSEKNPQLFYDIANFPELNTLEKNHETILSELNQLRNTSNNGYWLNSFPNYVDNKNNAKWQVFTFQFFNIKHPLNCSLCPKTYEVLKSIPNLISADFSFLPANTSIKPHNGFTQMVIRAHLGLIIPNDCGIRVGNEIRNWEKGKMLIFDDSYEHEAWNNSNEDRFVLMLDIANPKWDYSAKEISKYKIENIKDDFMLSMFSKEKWLHFLEIGELDVFPAIGN